MKSSKPTNSLVMDRISNSIDLNSYTILTMQLCFPTYRINLTDKIRGKSQFRDVRHEKGTLKPKNCILNLCVII